MGPITILASSTLPCNQYYFNYERSKDIACPEDHIKERGKQMRTVWDIPNNKERHEIQFGKHPTQKPIRLLKRMLEISAQPGQILIVPFAGSGSECVAAQEFGMHFVAFETDPDYIEICQKRLAHKTYNLASLSLSVATP